MKKLLTQNGKGFALLYTVVVISLILTIAISISNVSYKQSILSSLAKDSQAAFYQADAGAECALYYDIAQNMFPAPLPLGSAPGTLSCGSTTLKLSQPQSAGDYFVYEFSSPTNTLPCYSILIDKSSTPGTVIIESRGHNICGSGPRQVERAVRVSY